MFNKKSLYYLYITLNEHKMKKSINKERVSKVILSVLNSPNKSVQRAALWARLIKLRETLN